MQLMRALSLGLAVAFAATTASAELRSLTGNARYQIGNGLPIPIFGPPPTGDVDAIPGAQVSNGPGNSLIFLTANQMTHPGTKRTVGVFPANNAVFQVATALVVGFPAAPGTFSAGGRSGPATVTWCPGTVAPVAGAPACGLFPGGGTIPGGIRYTATGAQFGGPMRASVAGIATVALRVAGTPPGVVTGVNAFANPAGLNAIGATFNVLITTVPPVPTPASGVFVGNADAAGLITNVLASGVGGSGVANGATSYGAPWTTGRITVSQQAASPVEVFVLSGSDSRDANGFGAISLVSGSISARTLSGPNANRGWLNLLITPLGSTSVPVLPAGALAAAAGLVALAGSYRLRRRTEAV